MAKKPSGEIGATRITGTTDGQTSRLNSVSLPVDKESLEHYFCKRFVEKFNEEIQLGGKTPIDNLTQLDTSDLDFEITSQSADYIELAELAPISQDFGKEARRTGILGIYEYSKWIWQDIIKKKATKYGDLSNRVFLVLYATHWQFQPSQSLIQCLQSTLSRKGCRFAAVYLFQAGGTGEDALNIIHVLHPFDGKHLPPPRNFLGAKVQNFEPGKSGWKVTI